MGEALPRQDDALADRCAFAVMLARTRVGFGGSPERIFGFCNACDSTEMAGSGAGLGVGIATRLPGR